jgi:NDP-sugar pyrophosphorylase family protein
MAVGILLVGGFGTRLKPLTDESPKPMLPVAGKPMLEHIIERAKLNGFNRFLISINYLGHIIEEYFGSGGKLNVEIDYIRESFPLGTAGSLGLIDPIPAAPFVVVNGDVITNIDYGEFLDFHNRNRAIAAMAVQRHEWQNPYGVVQVDGMDIIGFREKPVVQAYINAGVYALDPIALGFLNVNTYVDMPSLFEKLRLERLRTIIYPMHESWRDIGQVEAYEAVNRP